MNYVFGSGASYINYALEGDTYGTADGTPAHCLIRPGSMPSKSQQRTHATYLTGTAFDPSDNVSFSARNIVEGSYNFYVTPSFITLIKACNTLSDGKMPSFTIKHPMLDNTAVQTGFMFTGMKPNQINISVPGDNSLAEGSISFMGKDVSIDDIGAIPSDEDNSFYEGWSMHVNHNTVNYSVYDFNLNINNSLVTPVPLSSTLDTPEPVEGLREVTGSFTVVFDKATVSTENSLLHQLFNNASSGDPVALKMQLSSSANTLFQIDMANAILEQGSTPTDISTDFLRYSVTFRALHDKAVTDQPKDAVFAVTA